MFSEAVLEMLSFESVLKGNSTYSALGCQCGR